MLDIPKDYLYDFLNFFLKNGKKEYFPLILGKPKNLSELEIFLQEIEFKHEHGYSILGCGVVDSSILSLDTKQDDFDEIMETFIPIRNDKELESFKEQVLKEINNYKINEAEKEENLIIKLKEGIKEILPDIKPETENYFLEILKNSRNLKKEKLYLEVDKVIKIVEKRETAVKLFNLINKNLKNYNKKDRNLDKNEEE